MSLARTLEVGPYRGVVVTEYQEPNFLAQLVELSSLVSAPTVEVRPFGRARIVRAAMRCNGSEVPIAIKAFGGQGLLGSRLARSYGSKAERSWGVASALWDRGIGTPRPIGFLESWDDSRRLAESYFLAEFADGASDFHTELLHLWHEEFQLGKFLNLMDVVAAAVRKMHDAGVQHGDLGNQNILVRRVDDDTWADVQFIDVNRGRARHQLSLRERAFDLSRLTLPPRLLKYFLNIYYREHFFEGQRPPRDLTRWVDRYRRRFALHTWTRPLRHPIKSWRNRKRKAGQRDYPPARERWLWDERSDQAIATLTHLERVRHRSVGTAVKRAVASVTRVLPAMKQYRKTRREAYRHPVALAGGVGMTIHPTPETADRERAHLEQLGRVPLLVRYYHHDAPAQWDFTTRHIRSLHDAGYPVSLALIQDRKAISHPERWRAFLDHVLAGVGDIAEDAEVGHATNRSKWGVWGHADYRTLLREFQAARAAYPNLGLMGPAVNDFEYPSAAAALDSLPADVRFDAMSLHLYVDRRGAPENHQHGFSAVDKFALARVLARRSDHCADRVVVSEVNWFLKDNGRYAHPFAPYAPPKAAHEWDVDEETYADYMLRYYLHALCSGMVDRVYWWRLVNAPFGLIDDSDPNAWRPRPAFRALQVFLDRYRDATFVGRIDAGDEDTYLLRLERSDGTEDVAAFHAGGDRMLETPFAAAARIDRSGEDVPIGAPIGGRVSYFTDAK